MTDPITTGEGRTLDPVSADQGESQQGIWVPRLVKFLRVLACVSLMKGLYHWAIVCGIDAPSALGFDAYSTPFQAATVFFAVIDLVAAVGLWLAAAWGGVVWLTATITMAMGFSKAAAAWAKAASAPPTATSASSAARMSSTRWAANRRSMAGCCAMTGPAA